MLEIWTREIQVVWFLVISPSSLFERTCSRFYVSNQGISGR